MAGRRSGQAAYCGARPECVWTIRFPSRFGGHRPRLRARWTSFSDRFRNGAFRPETPLSFSTAFPKLSTPPFSEPPQPIPEIPEILRLGRSGCRGTSRSDFVQKVTFRPEIHVPLWALLHESRLISFFYSETDSRNSRNSPESNPPRSRGTFPPHPPTSRKTLHFVPKFPRRFP